MNKRPKEREKRQAEKDRERQADTGKARGEGGATIDTTYPCTIDATCPCTIDATYPCTIDTTYPCTIDATYPCTVTGGRGIFGDEPHERTVTTATPAEAPEAGAKSSGANEPAEATSWVLL